MDRTQLSNHGHCMPQEISHWLHPQHPLNLHSIDKENGICEGCTYAFGSNIIYECEACRFQLCVECSSSRISRRPLQWKNNKLVHYSHIHELTRCTFLENDKHQCRICDLRMWGVGYACVRCPHFIHESCIHTPQIIEYYYHPQHPLMRLDFPKQDYKKTCKFCRGDIFWEDYPFGCTECNYYLHFHCADCLFRPIKLECHTHSLLYIPTMPPWGYIKCFICSVLFDNTSDHYLCCVQCDEACHFNCVSIPRYFKNKLHQHILTLNDPFYEYMYEEYYCDICEARIHPTSREYCCEQCKFFGHIECVLFKDDGVPNFLSSLWSRKRKKDEPATLLDCSSQKQIQYASHDHPLSLENFIGELCRICKLEINGPGFKCNRCLNAFFVHAKCAALPENLDHPLHPNHMLSLFRRFPGASRNGEFICDICREISEGLNFLCRTCGFVIDIKCAFLNKGAQPFDEKGWEKTLNHPVHYHNLILTNATRLIHNSMCHICSQNALGLIYCCSKWWCDVRYHTTCLDWPAVVEQHTLHPQHRLKLVSTGFRELWCFACGVGVKLLGYKCENFSHECRVAFHLECANSLARLLKYNDHHLYYFHKRPSKGCRRVSFSASKCTFCDGEIKSSYYRCMKCKLHFHLGCLYLPYIAKHEYHLHQLIFKDLVDFGGYYCDICEEPRDFEHPVYCCEECELVACINCIVSEENASSVILEEIESDGVKIPVCSSRLVGPSY